MTSQEEKEGKEREEELSLILGKEAVLDIVYGIDDIRNNIIADAKKHKTEEFSFAYEEAMLQGSAS